MADFMYAAETPRSSTTLEKIHVSSRGISAAGIVSFQFSVLLGHPMATFCRGFGHPNRSDIDDCINSSAMDGM
jgi:hypothetical protein